MHVLLVSHHAPPHIGGVENLVLMEAKAFLADGHTVTWITSDGTGAGRDVPELEGLTIRRVWAWHIVEKLFGIAYPLFAPSLAWHLWRAVGKADIVHVHGLVFPGSPMASLLARLRKTQCICTDHGGMLKYKVRVANWAMRFLMATLGRVTARCSHKLIPYNHDVEKLLVRLSGNPDKVQFLANPIDVSMFKPPTPEQRAAARKELGWNDKPRALCVSRLLPHKGIDILLEANDGSFEVVFCGPGEESMREHIRKHGGTALAPRPHKDILTLYHAADVFAMPSHNEGFPVVVQEALACGLPVVTSDMPAYDSYRGTPGLTLCEPTPEVVRKHIRTAIGDRDASRDLAKIDCGRAVWLEDLCRPIGQGADQQEGAA